MNKVDLKKILSILFSSYFLFFVYGCDSGDDRENYKVIEEVDLAPESPSEGYSDSPTETRSDYSSKSDRYDDYYEQETADGIYKYETSEGSFIISISGDTWRSEYIIVTGFGAAYDRQNAQYDSGMYYNGGLYDNSGYVQLGSVSSGRVNFSGVNLYK